MRNFSSRNKVNWRRKLYAEWRQLFQSERLPHGWQYITLPHFCADQEGRVIAGSEYDAACQELLISRKQFVGIDEQADVIERNSSLPGTWIHANAYLGLVQLEAQGKLNPAFVSWDSQNTPAVGMPEFARILNDPLRCVRRCLAVGTFVLANRHIVECGWDALKEEVAKHSFVGWTLMETGLEYDGAYEGESTCVMGSVLLYRL